MVLSDWPETYLQGLIGAQLIWHDTEIRADWVFADENQYFIAMRVVRHYVPCYTESGVSDLVYQRCKQDTPFSVKSHLFIFK
jgi:hypothetical protein